MMSKMGGLGGMDNPMGVSVNPTPVYFIVVSVTHQSVVKTTFISSFFSTFPVPAKKKIMHFNS